MVKLNIKKTKNIYQRVQTFGMMFHVLQLTRLFLTIISNILGVYVAFHLVKKAIGC
jgi:hypothetical protein